MKNTGTRTSRKKGEKKREVCIELTLEGGERKDDEEEGGGDVEKKRERIVKKMQRKRLKG